MVTENYDNYLSTDQVAKMFQVTSYSVRKWIKAEKMKGVKVGNKYLVKKQWLENFINEEKKKGI